MKPTDDLVANIICHTAETGLTIISAANADTITIIDATPVAVNDICPECGHSEKLHNHILRRPVDLSVIGFPSRLDTRVPRFLCTAASCPRKISWISLACVGDGSKLTHHVTRWILWCLAISRMSVSATAKTLGIDWDLVDQVAFSACRQLVYDDPHHLDGVRILGVDEHVWKHTRKPGQPSNLVTIPVDLTLPVGGRGPARLPDLHPGRNVEVLRTWPQERDLSLRSQVQVVTIDGLTGYASAADQVPPDATKVMDPFHVVRLAVGRLTGCRRRL